jgi:hypothetical protein
VRHLYGPANALATWQDGRLVRKGVQLAEMLFTGTPPLG